MTNELSASLNGLLGQFAPHTHSGIHLSKLEVSNIVMLLGTMQRIAMSMEQELVAHRLGEVNRVGRAMVDDLAVEKLGSLLTETGGNVIRPRFGK